MRFGRDLRGRQLASGTPLLAEVLAGVMMQVPGAFAGINGAPTSFPHQAATPVDGRAFEGHWGPLSPPSVGATTRDEQWTVCRDMIRGGSNGPRAHFTRATISACRLPQREQASRLAPIEDGRFGAVPSSHFGGIGFDPMLGSRSL